MSTGVVHSYAEQVRLVDALCEAVGERKVEIWDRMSACATDPHAVNLLTEELEAVEHVERVVVCVRTMVSFLQQYELPSVCRLIAVCGLYMRIEDREVRASMWGHITSMLEPVRAEADALGRAMLEARRARADLLRARAEYEREVARRERARAEEARRLAQLRASRTYEQARRDTAPACEVA
jgi:hypothetical protein